MDAFAWSVIGSVAGVVGAGAAIAFGVIPLWQGRAKTRLANAEPTESEVRGGRLVQMLPGSRQVSQDTQVHVESQAEGRPDSVPRVWNPPARNPGFTGRDELLVAVREQLTAGNRGGAGIRGDGRIGQDAASNRVRVPVRGSYDLGWWVDSE
jgi:hypothetical protein